MTPETSVNQPGGRIQSCVSLLMDVSRVALIAPQQITVIYLFFLALAPDVSELAKADLWCEFGRIIEWGGPGNDDHLKSITFSRADVLAATPAIENSRQNVQSSVCSEGTVDVAGKKGAFVGPWDKSAACSLLPQPV